ncbi:MAG: hypothetical protein HC933_17950 [Pleurocapsa sp. SU_196_0]|nr:hypothetical protein [Pleurocapsa sp. SU_196_0]
MLLGSLLEGVSVGRSLGSGSSSTAGAGLEVVCAGRGSRGSVGLTMGAEVGSGGGDGSGAGWGLSTRCGVASMGSSETVLVSGRGDKNTTAASAMSATPTASATICFTRTRSSAGRCSCGI